MNVRSYRFSPTTAMFLLTVVVPLHSQQPADWKDPSSHVRRFVTVSDNVRLEVLDWGGSGRPVVLIPGGGNTAHVFDGFASKLTADFHVYGITRRGFGESGFAPPTSGSDTYGDDVLAVLDALKLERPVLVGHSIGGQELSSVATRFPSRVAAVVYLEAGYPYAFDNGKGPTFEQMQSLRGPQAPQPTEADLASFTTLQQFLLRVQGVTFPEAELRQQRAVSPDGRIGKPRDFPGYSTLLGGMKKYFEIRVPALVVFALPHGLGRWIESSTDPEIREQARAYAAALNPLTVRQAQLIEAGVPTARVVKLPGAHHHIFLSHEADVIREIRTFLGRLQ